MTPQEFAKEFVKDFQEDLKEQKNTDFSYYFNKTVLKTDPNLKFVKQELNKIGYTLVNIENDLWKPIPKGDI